MSSNERLRDVLAAVVGSVKTSLAEVGVTNDELRFALAYLTDVGRHDEFVLLSDVLGLSVFVDGITHDRDDGVTAHNVQGPFYVEDAPVLDPPFELAGAEEPGEPLEVIGRVADVDGAPLPGALLDVWQANAAGLYSNQDPALGEFHLRGRIPVGEDGRYAFRTIVPPPYEIPKDGPVGRLLRELDRHAFRPAHLHLKVTCAGHAPLTTMIYFGGDEYLGSDPIDSVKDSLVVPIEREGSGTTGAARCRFDIALRPV
jgi:catechol 1,2-dioxygenase